MTDATATPVRAFRLFDAQRAPGLPQSTVMALYQCDAGRLWIATLDGLGIFDGTEIRGVEPAPDAPVYGSLYSLARRGDGGLWVGGASQVWSWDGESWRVYSAPGAASSLAEDGLGRLWRIDQSGGLWRFDTSRLDPVATAIDSATEAAQEAELADADAAFRAAGPWTRVPTPDWLGPAVAVQSPVWTAGVEAVEEVDVRTGPKLWLAGQRGVGMLTGERFRPVAGGAPSDASITALLTARDGTVWVASEGGALHYTVAGGWRRARVPGWDGGHVRALAEGRRGLIWAGGLAGGIAFGRTGDPWTTWDESNGLRGEGVLALLADREGTLWLSANGFGLQQWIGEAWSHRNVWQGEVADARQPIFGITPTLTSEEDGSFYAAVFARGVWHWDGRRLHEYGEDDGLTENVHSVFEPEPGVLWVSARFGIYERRAAGETFRRIAEIPSGFVYGVQRAPDGTFWAHTSAHGLLIRRGGKTDWTLYKEINRDLPDRNVKAVYFRSTSSGENTAYEVWLGTLSGLVVVRNGRVETLSSDAATALPGAAQAIHEDPFGDVWVAGFGGVSRVPGGDLSAEIETLTQADGLPSRTIYSLVSTGDSTDEGDHAELWMGGSDGLGRLSLQTRHRPGLPAGPTPVARTIRVYDASDGLTEDECNHMGLHPAPDGSLYVGTMASLARFDPAIEHVADAPLRVRWLERPGDGVELPANRRSVPLRWHAPWLAPEPVEYRTRVPRLDDRWSAPSPRPSLDLENLGPGTWRVEVSARRSDRSGSTTQRGWTEPVATTFHVAPYFRETPAFYGLCALLLAALVFAFVRWRTARLRSRAAELQAAVDEALAQIKVLGGLMPICAGCKMVRDDEGYWQQIESYLHVHSEAELSHGLCPDCASEMYGPYLEPEKLAAEEAAREEDQARSVR